MYNENNITKNKKVEEAIVSMSKGSVDAMDILYPLIKTDIFSFALSRVLNQFDADDITQETFIKIYQNAKLYTPQGKPMAWIIRIEENVINQFFNNKKKYQHLEESSVVSENNETFDEKAELIKELFKDLDEEEKKIISMHLVSSLKFKEISKILEKPLSTVLSKYNRAIKKIQRNVKENNRYEQI